MRRESAERFTPSIGMAALFPSGTVLGRRERCLLSGACQANDEALVVAQAEHRRGGRFGVVVCDAKILRSVSGGSFTQRLRRIILVGQAPLGGSLNLQSIGMRPMGGGDAQRLCMLVMRHARLARHLSMRESRAVARPGFRKAVACEFQGCTRQR